MSIKRWCPSYPVGWELDDGKTHEDYVYVLAKDHDVEVSRLKHALNTASLFCSAGGKAIIAKALYASPLKQVL